MLLSAGVSVPHFGVVLLCFFLPAFLLTPYSYVPLVSVGFIVLLTQQRVTRGRPGSPQRPQEFWLCSLGLQRVSKSRVLSTMPFLNSPFYEFSFPSFLLYSFQKEFGLEAIEDCQFNT